MNNCEFHEICDKCGYPEITKKKLKTQCVYKSEDCDICPHWCENCDEAGHPTVRCLEDKEPVGDFETVYNINGVSVKNTLYVVEKLFLSNGWDIQTSHEAKELLRPLFIYLDRHKELCEKNNLKKGIELGKTLSLSNKKLENVDFVSFDDNCSIEEIIHLMKDRMNEIIKILKS